MGELQAMFERFVISRGIFSPAEIEQATASWSDDGYIGPIKDAWNIWQHGFRMGRAD